MLFLFHHQKYLNIIVVVIFLYWFIPMLITANKNNIPFGYFKKLNTNFQDQMFNHRTFLKIDPHTGNHLLKLVCTILMFGYQVMFNGGHLYPIYIVLYCHVEISQTIVLTMLLIVLTSLFLEGALRWFHNV